MQDQNQQSPIPHVETENTLLFQGEGWGACKTPWDSGITHPFNHIANSNMRSGGCDQGARGLEKVPQPFVQAEIGWPESQPLGD